MNVLGKVEMRAKDETGSSGVAEEAENSTRGSAQLRLRNSVIQLPCREHILLKGTASTDRGHTHAHIK